MLNKAVIFAGLTFTLLFRASVFAGGKNELADKYYSLLQGADGTSAKFVWAELYKEVSPSERDELFASIIDRGMKEPKGLTNPGAIAWILDALGSTGPNRTWSPHLERVVLAQAKNKDPVIRGLLPDALSMHGRDKYRTLCLSYLDDPDKVFVSVP